MLKTFQRIDGKYSELKMKNCSSKEIKICKPDIVINELLKKFRIQNVDLLDVTKMLVK